VKPLRRNFRHALLLDFLRNLFLFGGVCLRVNPNRFAP
jgi:hypothetical protein